MADDIFWALVVAAALAAMIFFAFRTPGSVEEHPDDAPPVLPELEECDRCGRKVLDLGYHRRRCLGRPSRFRHSQHSKPFRPRDRRDKT